jgi:hypothetical protein
MHEKCWSKIIVEIVTVTWFIKGRVVGELPVIHAPLGSFENSRGIPGFQIWPKLESMVPNSSDRHNVVFLPGFQKGRDIQAYPLEENGRE